MRYVALSIGLTVAAATAQAADFQSMSKAQVRSEIKARCQQSMGQYGDSMTLACMKQDWSAAQQVKTQLNDHPKIAHRCLDRMRDYGYAMVEACIEQDAGAQSQIDHW